MDNSSIKENIRKARKECGKTQEEMALLLGISLTAYRDIEKGPTAIINGNVFRIAEAAGVSMEELLLGFRPSPSDGRLEDAQAEYGNREKTLLTRISDLEKIVRSLEETIQGKNETIQGKNELISMLKKIIDGKE